MTRRLVPSKVMGRSRSTNWAAALGWQCTAGLNDGRGFPVKCDYEVLFHPLRKWRFDVAIRSVKLAVEIDGGGFVNGRHSRGTGIEKDCEKYAEAMLLGWRVLRVTPKHVKSGQALRWVEKLLSKEP